MKKNVKELLNKIKEKFIRLKHKIGSNKEVKKINSIFNKYKKKLNNLYIKNKKELENILILISYIFIYYNLIILTINAGIYLWYKGFNFLIFFSMLIYLCLLIYTMRIKFKSPYKILAMILIIEILI